MFESAKTLLEQAGVVLQEAQAFDQAFPMQKAIEQAVAQKRHTVILGGGDGTLGTAVDLIAGSETALAVMPLGTGNQFAREIGIGHDIRAAVTAISEGGIAKMDLGRANGNGFLTVATLGLSTHIARNMVGKKQVGQLAYLPGLVRGFLASKPFEVEIVTDHVTVKKRAIQIVVCNGRTHAGPFWASPDATATDGMLDTYAVADMNPVQLAKAASLALVGKHVDLPDVSAVKAAKLTIRTDPQMPLTVDGEEIWHDEMVFTLESGGILVHVPPHYRCPDDRWLVAPRALQNP